MFLFKNLNLEEMSQHTMITTSFFIVSFKYFKSNVPTECLHHNL